MKTKHIATAVLFAAAIGTAHADTPAYALATMNGWVEKQLVSNQTSVSAYLFLMLGGILASLLPCVYPLYPITASIIRGRSSNQTSRFLHPVTYYAGVSGVYFLLGLLAGATGGAFNEMLRLPITNLLLALIFLMLALATAGFIHLSWLNGGTMGEKTPGLPGTFVMGMGAGLLSSSCVGPFVVSILVGLASQAGAFDLGSTLVAAVKMLSFGMGLGIPLLLIGLFGVKLPKSGAWMKYVQWTVGALILYFSFVYLGKGLAGYSYKPESIQAVFFGALILLFSVYRWDAGNIDGDRRMQRALHALFAVVGGLLLTQGVLTGTGPGLAAVSAEPVKAEATETRGELTWYLNREDAVKASRQQGKPIFVDFFAYWCANCKEFEKLTESDPELIGGLKHAVLLKIYDTDPEFKSFQNDPRYPELKVGLPFFLIIDADDKLIYKTSDYTRTDEMLLFLGG